MKTGYGIITVLLATAISFFGCAPAITEEAPKEEETAEEALVSFMLDFIVQQEIGGTADYIQSSGQPWVDAHPGANIIIWSPPVEDADDYYPRYVDSHEPIKVWLYADDELAEAVDKIGTIQDYEQTHMSDPESNIWAWGYYEFGIMSISSNDQEAQVYVGVSCGPLCGHGYMYTLKRNTSGQWEIQDSQWLWVS